jgi:hypothetical protein
MRRTATVRAVDYSTISSLSQNAMQELQKIFPTLISQFKTGIKDNYKDHDFLFKNKIIESVPYFSKLSEDIITEIVLLMKSEKFDKGSKIVKRGDNVDKLFFLYEGVIEVQVPFLEKNLHFDYLTPGSNFCVFSCYNHKSQSVVNFASHTSCIVNFIEVEDLIALSRRHIDLKLVIRKLYAEHANSLMNDFDFFRFNPQISRNKRNLTENI